MKKNNSDHNNIQNENNGWLQKVKEVGNKILQIGMQHKKYIAAGCLMVGFVLLLVFATGTKDKSSVADQNITEVEKNSETKVQKLLNAYYSTYQKADIATLKSYATPISDNEGAYIQLFAAHVEKYELKEYFTKEMTEKDMFLVSARINITFKGVKQTAPGLDFFVVRKAKDGRLYIDNVYSQFNLQVEEYAHDKNILKQIHDYEKEEEIVKIQKEIQKEYDKAIAASPELKTLVEQTVQQEISGWFSTAKIVQFQKKPDFSLPTVAGKEPAKKPEKPAPEKPTTPETPATPVTPAPAPAPAPTPAPSSPLPKYQSKAAVNMRETPSTSANTVYGVPKDGIVKYLEASPDGTWSKVSYSGMVGYIKNDFLIAPTLPNVNGLYQGEIIAINQTVNVRETMSETANKLGTAFKGEFATVIAGYEQGWTLISWNGLQGYVLTSLIQQ